MTTKEARIKWIFEKMVASPLLSSGDLFTLYLKENKPITERTFHKYLKEARKEFEAYQKKVQKEKEAVSIEVEKEAIKKGLKTKIERLLILQNEVDKIIREIENGYCMDKIVLDGIPTCIMRPLRPMEISAMRKNIKELQAEISKIEGDYATARHDLTSNGESISGINAIKVNIILPQDDE